MVRFLHFLCFLCISSTLHGTSRFHNISFGDPFVYKHTDFMEQLFVENANTYKRLNATKMYLENQDLLWKEDPRQWHQQLARIIDHRFSTFEEFRAFAQNAKQAGVSALMLVGVQNISQCPGGWYGGLQLCDHINGDFPASDGTLPEWQKLVNDLKPMRLMWWTNMDYWSVQGPVWNTALHNSNSKEHSFFSWGASGSDECWGHNPNGAQGSWGSSGSWSGYESALASWGSQNYANYLIDALANSWVKNLGVEGFTIDCVTCYNRGTAQCKNGMLQTPNGDAMSSWGKIVHSVRSQQPTAVFSAEIYNSWEDVIKTDSDVGGQGYAQFHTDTQNAIYNGDLSNVENSVRNTGADAATLLCYLNPYYDGKQPGACPTLYFRDMTATMSNLRQYRMWVALEAASGIVPQHDYDKGNGQWWSVQNDPFGKDESPLWAFTKYRALNRLSLRTKLNVISGNGALAYLKHDSMGPNGDAAILIFNPGRAQSVTIDLSSLPSWIIDGSITPTNLLPKDNPSSTCYTKLQGGIPVDEGTEVGKSSGGSLQDCELSCTLNPICRSLSFTTNWGGLCFLKNKVVTPNTPTKYDANFVSYYQSKCKPAPNSYRQTKGYCRGSPSWASGDVWDCTPGNLYNDGCKAACDITDDCGSYDRPDSSGSAECCLFRPGGTGDGESGRSCYVASNSPFEEESSFPPLTSRYTIEMGDVDMKFLSSDKLRLGVFAPRQGKKGMCKSDDGYVKKMRNSKIQDCFMECLKDGRCHNVFLPYKGLPLYGPAPSLDCILLGAVNNPDNACNQGTGTLVKKLENGRS